MSAADLGKACRAPGCTTRVPHHVHTDAVGRSWCCQDESPYIAATLSTLPVTADVQRELAEAHLPEIVSRWAAEGFRDIGGLSAFVLEARLIERLLPTVQALIADAEKRAAAQELRAVADEYVWVTSATETEVVSVRDLHARAAALDPSGAAEGAGQ